MKSKIQNLITELEARSKSHEQEFDFFSPNDRHENFWKGCKSECDFVIQKLEFLLKNESDNIQTPIFPNKLINVIIKDSNETELILGDVVCVHNPNPLIKYFGVLTFKPRDNSFVLSDMADGYEAFGIRYKKYERLCHIDDVPAMKKELGYVEVTDKKEFDKLFSLCKQH